MKKFLAMALACILAMMLMVPLAAFAEQAPVNMVLYWTQLGDEATVGWQALMDEFARENPGYTVEFRGMSNVSDTIKVQIAAGSGPEFMMMDAFDIMDYTKAGYLMNLEEMSKEGNWADSLYDWAYKCCSINGELMAMPWSSEVTMMQYNELLMDKYGWTPPTNREEFVSLMESAGEEGLIPISYGFSGLPLLNQWLYDHYINAYAGSSKLREVLTNQTPWTDPEIVDAIKLLKADWDAGYIQEKKAHAISNDIARSTYYQGKSLMNTEGTWLTFDSSESELFSDTLQNGFALWPSFREGLNPTTSITCGEVIGVNAKADLEGVRRFLNFLMTNDKAICDVTSAGVIPPPREIDWSYLPDGMTKNSLQALEAISTLPQSTDNVGWAPWGFYPTKCNQYLYENLDKVFLDVMGTEEYLANAQAAFEQDVADGYVFSG